MIRRINFQFLFFVFGVSLLVVIASNKYSDTENYKHIKNYMQLEDGNEYYLPANTYNEAFNNIDKILEYIQKKIQIQLKDIEKIDGLLMEKGGRPIRSIIVSTWRSGSTFLGELLNSVPGNFYNYEPLLQHGEVQIRGVPDSIKAMTYVKKMLQCNYDNMSDYFQFGILNLHQFTHNTRLWEFCKLRNPLCFNPNFTSKFCKLFPYQSMKLVRMRLRLLEDIIRDESLNAKIVFLIRDPRGVMQSRQHPPWCKPSPDCWQPERLCADMVNDYGAAVKLMKQYKNKLMIVRYEEMAFEPLASAHMVLNFLQLSVTPSVERFLRSHTSRETPGLSSTYRISREVPLRWKNLLDFDYVEQIQESCKEAMSLWGYNFAHNATHLRSREFNPVGPFHLEL